MTAEVLRAHANVVVPALLRGADAGAAVTRHLSVHNGVLRVGRLRRPLHDIRHLSVLAMGKAAVRMADTAARVLDHHVGVSLVIAPHGAQPSVLPTRFAGHPLPDADGIDASDALPTLAGALDARDHALVLLSGGASAMLAAPPEGIGLMELRATTLALLRSGADVHDINTVRRHLSRIAGGWLAATLHPCPSWTMVLSDVDDLSVVGSGPTSPDPTTFGHALAVIDRYLSHVRLPESVVSWLERGASGLAPETPKPGDPWFDIAHVGLAGSVAHAVDEGQAALLRLGYDANVESVHLTGEAHEVGERLARAALALQPDLTAPAAWLFGGETTVTVTGEGRGGRNQELALAAALVLEGAEGVLVLTLATDGVDGPTDAAGAVVDGATVPKLRDLGLDRERALNNHDTHPCLDAVDALIRTGPTGTNTMDVTLVLIHPRRTITAPGNAVRRTGPAAG